MRRLTSSGAGSIGVPPPAMQATRATSRSTWPFAHVVPRRTMGTVRIPNSASSAKPCLSSSTLTDTKGTPCLVKNSFIRRQLVHPGCQYALITWVDCAIEWFLGRPCHDMRERHFCQRSALSLSRTPRRRHCNDGGDPAYLEYALDNGIVPNIARFMKSGFAATAQAVIPS